MRRKGVLLFRRRIDFEVVVVCMGAETVLNLVVSDAEKDPSICIGPMQQTMLESGFLDQILHKEITHYFIDLFEGLGKQTKTYMQVSGSVDTHPRKS